MTRMNFISRHVPNADQIQLAADRGFDLVHIGDVDAFDADAVSAAFSDHPGTAFAVVNPALALNLASLAWATDVTIGVFQNAARPVDGGKPTFKATALHVWTVNAGMNDPHTQPVGVTAVRQAECDDCGAVVNPTTANYVTDKSGVGTWRGVVCDDCVDPQI